MVTATLRRPKKQEPQTAPAGAVIDVEAQVTGVDETSAEKLAEELEAGAPAPGSAEAAQAEMEQGSASAAGLRAPATRSNYADTEGGVEGDFDASDLKLPQFKVVNGSGDLSKRFNQGSLILGDELLAEPPSMKAGAEPATVRFIPLKIQKQYRETLTQDEMEEGLMPRTVNTVAEAEALSGAGATLWANGQKPRWTPSAKCVFLIEEPEGNTSGAFTHDLDGKRYALAIHYSANTAYADCGKRLFNAAQTILRERDAASGENRILLCKRVWVWQTVKKTFKRSSFTTFGPVITLTKEESGSDVRELAHQLNALPAQE